MTALSERVLVQHLLNSDSIALLAREDVSLDVLPTEQLHPVYLFALDYWYGSGCLRAPTVEVLRCEDAGSGKTMGDLLDDLEIDISTEPEESIQWAIDNLRSTYLHASGQSFVKQFAMDLAEAEGADRMQVMSQGANRLLEIIMRLESRQHRTTLRHGVEERLQAYQEREERAGSFEGMAFGMPLVDQHIYGIHPGELAVVGAYAKTGKSFFVDKVALEEYLRGRVVALYTLENSIAATVDRIACAMAHIDYGKWQRGEVSKDEKDLLRVCVDSIRANDTNLHIIQPEAGHRTPVHIVREAQVLGADSLIIDQLSHIEHPEPRNKPRQEVVRDIMQQLFVLISASGDPLPCLLAAQISREGYKAADKRGYYEMHDLAESSEIERSADFVFSIYQSNDMGRSGHALFQTLAARRVKAAAWDLNWQIGLGMINANHVVTERGVA